MRILVVGPQNEAKSELCSALRRHAAKKIIETDDLIGCEESLNLSRWDAVLINLELIDFQNPSQLGELILLAPGASFVGYDCSATIPDAVEALHHGFDEFLGIPLKEGRLERVVARVQKSSQTKRRQSELEYEQERHKVPLRFESQDENVIEVFSMAARVAPTDATVMVLGESGTGKSVLARAIHEGSQREGEPIVTVNCPSLSSELLESELFGHKKGAFTGAISDKLGKVAEAEGGTLFLDEIGELPIELQPKLLRLLQDRVYERVGDNETRHADVRLISATNRDLQAEVESGGFREDLFYRLNVITIRMPSLRERRNDLEALSESYVRYFSAKMGRQLAGISPSGMAAIRSYTWPGNLRELRNVTERAVILCTGDELQPNDLGLKDPDDESMEGWGYPNTWSLQQVEAEHIERVVGSTNSIEDAATVLGINPSTLYRKRKEYGIG